MNRKPIFAILFFALVVGVAIIFFLQLSNRSVPDSVNETLEVGKEYEQEVLSDNPLNLDRFPSDSTTGSKYADTIASSSQTSTAAEYSAHLDEITVNRVISLSTDLEYENEYLVADTELYTVWFIGNDQLFTIVLKKIPLEPGIASVEDFMLTLLQVTPDELCEMRIDVFAPTEYDPDLTQDLGFSRCPGPRAPTTLH